MGNGWGSLAASFQVGVARNRPAGASQKVEEPLDGETRASYQRAKGAYGQFPVLGDGQIGSDSCFNQDKVAPHLPDGGPPGLFKSLRSFFSRDIRQAAHAQTATTMGCSPGFSGRVARAF